MSTSTARTVCDDSETLDSAAHEDPTTSTTCIQHSTLMDKDVFKKYKILKVLGHGSMGTVAKVTIRPHRIGGSAVRSYNSGLFGTGIWKRKQQTHEIQLSASTEQPNHVYALKSIRLECVSGSFAKELHNEIDILKTLDHPNIVRLHEVYTCDREHQLYLVLDLCDGGDLYARAPYSQRHAASLMDQLVSAVQYMHHHGVVHRDLKFENVMFESNSESSAIKVIDFGLSKHFAHDDIQNRFMNERVGTIYTMAPQVLQGIYSSQADMWAIGVLAFMLLGNKKPFYDRNRSKMIDLIMRADYTFDSKIWDGVAPSAKDFVNQLLVVDPSVRMDAPTALQHEWIVNRDELDNERPSQDILDSIDHNLIKYKNTSALKKIALNVIAHRSTADEIEQLRKAFEYFDAKRDGVITFGEFREALAGMNNYSDESLRELFSSIDINKTGQIMYTEFLAATIEAQGHIAEDRIAEAFDRLDSDDTGYISKQNLFDALGSDASEEMAAIIKSVDLDKDGQVSYKEFLAEFRNENDVETPGGDFTNHNETTEAHESKFSETVEG